MFAYAITRGADAPLLADATDVDGRTLAHVTHADLLMLVSLGTPTADAPVAFMERVRMISEITTAIPPRAASDPIDESTALATLRSGAARFGQLLDRFDGAREWSLRIRPGTAIADDRSNSHTGATYLRRERLRLAQRDGIDKDAARAASVVTPKLAPFTRETRLLPSTDGAACLAMLVERTQEDDLCERAESIAREMGSDASFTGPYPAFSFTSPG